jgi:deoxyribodipyrimidine photo-lyase
MSCSIVWFRYDLRLADNPAPLFRIFNPVSQGEKFDPHREYVCRWVPELAELPARWIHHPCDAPAVLRRDASVSLGKTYPARIVEHDKARARALQAFAEVRRR